MSDEVRLVPLTKTQLRALGGVSSKLRSEDALRELVAMWENAITEEEAKSIWDHEEDRIGYLQTRWDRFRSKVRAAFNPGPETMEPEGGHMGSTYIENATEVTPDG